MCILYNENNSLNLTKEENQKRELLLRRIKEIGIENVIEESAYTWFNRLIALRYMEIHDYIPLGYNNESLGIRVLSSSDNTPNPEILKFSNLINNQLDINFNSEIFSLLKNDNEKYKYILLLVCNKLKKVFPTVFDGVTDYIDLLIPENLLSETGFISKLIKEIPEIDFKKVEIIGWLYQYYNQIEKERVISAKQANNKKDIAYATQLFTPDWIVKYMVQNTLGKFWIEHSGDDSLMNEWEYFINENIEKKDYIDPKNIKVIDPCCGSGHILVYTFDLLYKIYESVGYNKKDIPSLILENNISGVDIDDRAGQLSILSILLKAREYDNSIFNKRIVNDINVMALSESNGIDPTVFSTDLLLENDISYLINTYNNCKEIGSLVLAKEMDFSNTLDKLENNIFDNILGEKLKPLIKQNNILSKKYDIVITNPPYMNKGAMTNNLKNYVFDKFSPYKTDLFSAFVVKNSYMVKNDGYLGFMTPYVWMFISSYDELRKYILTNLCIGSLVQLEYSAFEEAVVPICSFVLKKSENDLGTYIRLSDYKGGMNLQKEKYLEIINKKERDYYISSNKKMLSIPGNPICYWLDDNILNTFENKHVSDSTIAKSGVVTGNDNYFLKMWFEVNFDDISFDGKSSQPYSKYHLFQKGGAFCRWYGNNKYIIAL